MLHISDHAVERFIQRCELRCNFEQAKQELFRAVNNGARIKQKSLLGSSLLKLDGYTSLAVMKYAKRDSICVTILPPESFEQKLNEEASELTEPREVLLTSNFLVEEEALLQESLAEFDTVFSESLGPDDSKNACLEGFLVSKGLQKSIQARLQAQDNKLYQEISAAEKERIKIAARAQVELELENVKELAAKRIQNLEIALKVSKEKLLAAQDKLESYCNISNWLTPMLESSRDLPEISLLLEKLSALKED